MPISGQAVELYKHQKQAARDGLTRVTYRARGLRRPRSSTISCDRALRRSAAPAHVEAAASELPRISLTGRAEFELPLLLPVRSSVMALRVVHSRQVGGPVEPAPA
jgi:hypothetical protein